MAINYRELFQLLLSLDNNTVACYNLKEMRSDQDEVTIFLGINYIVLYCMDNTVQIKCFSE